MKFFPATARTVLDRRLLEDPDAPAITAGATTGFRRGPRAWTASAPWNDDRPRTVSTLRYREADGVPEAGARARSVAPDSASQLAAEPARLSADSRRVLVVDDDSTLRDVLARMLGGAGFNVSCAADGEAAWDALCAQDFDVLVTDHDMPRLSGLELLRRVRAEMRPVPVVFISGRMPWDDADLIRLLPPGLALEKPFSMADLVANVRGVLTATTLPGHANGADHSPTDRRNESSTSSEAPWSR